MVRFQKPNAENERLRYELTTENSLIDPHSPHTNQWRDEYPCARYVQDMHRNRKNSLIVQTKVCEAVCNDLFNKKGFSVLF